MRHTTKPEYREGASAAQNFDRTMNRILKVSKEELTKREAEYKKARATKKSSTPR